MPKREHEGSTEAEPAEKRLVTTPCATLELDGESLGTADLYALSRDNRKIGLTNEAWNDVRASRQVIDNILGTGEVAYGINTGFGLFSNVVISDDRCRELQENLIRSHSAGVGEPLSCERTRMLLALRINVLAKGHSGITEESLRRIIACFNAGCLSSVPCKGTVGASGDLAPLSHLALGMMGEGPMWDPRTGRIGLAAEILKAHGLKPLELGAKEGLALINGTQLIGSLGAEAVTRSKNVAVCADVACALTLEVLKGTQRAFHPRIHAVRPHKGQGLVAHRLRMLLQPGDPSEIFRNHGYRGKVQDAYTLRCAPQVHGIVNDTIDFVDGILQTELNSATDNPMVFVGDDNPSPEDSNVHNTYIARGASTAVEEPPPASAEKVEVPADYGSAVAEVHRLREELASQKTPKAPWQMRKTHASTFYRGEGGFIISGGNFHGEYPAKALDYLAIGVHELASISERRIERLVNPSISELPAFLVKEGGLNSGFMIAHCTAASLVSENKVLCHPSSVDSLSTSGAKEDHVSMGGFAARKACEVVEHVEMVIAIEILAACQAMEFARPLKSTPTLEAIHALVRKHVRPWDKDRHMSPDIEAVHRLIRSGEIRECAERHFADMPESKHQMIPNGK